MRIGMNRISFLLLMAICLTSTPTTRRVLGQGGGNLASSPAGSAEIPDWKIVEPTAILIPQTLLPLIHASEVQAELGIDARSLASLEEFFMTIDGDWWRSRNVPVVDRRKTISLLEEKLLDKLHELLSPEAVIRLRQIELQSHAARMILRPDVAAFLEATPQQISHLTELATEADALSASIEEKARQGESVEEAGKKLASLKQRENVETLESFSAAQRSKLAVIVGDSFDTASLSRIFPMAPELIVSDGWLDASAGSLASNRGKVVIIHFYAFQCYNCVANLPRYNEWNEKFSDEDVVIIGIQTPETSAERDADQIREAAIDQNIQYPVLLDLQNKNWNAWYNTMWPTVYVVDRRGYIRTWWQGELNWKGATGDKTIAEYVEKLLKEQ